MREIIRNPPKGLKNPNKWSKTFNNFISQCLTVNKNKRPSEEELLFHEFIDKTKKLNRKNIILQFLSKCGYNVIYSKKQIKIPKNLMNSKTSRKNLDKNENEKIDDKNQNNCFYNNSFKNGIFANNSTNLTTKISSTINNSISVYCEDNSNLNFEKSFDKEKQPSQIINNKNLNKKLNYFIDMP